MWKRRYALLALALLGVLLSGCDQGGRGPEPAPDSQQVLRVVAPPLVSLDPLDPAQYAYENRQALALLYSGLVTLDQSLRPIPHDATHVDVSADGLSYTFHLRSDLRFTDGAAITASDFAYSINRAIPPCGGQLLLHFQSLLLEHLKDAIAFADQGCGSGRPVPNGPQTLIPTLIGDSIVVDNASTVRLILDHPDAAFLAQLADPAFSVVDRRLVESSRFGWTLTLADHGGQGTSGMYVVKSLEMYTQPPRPVCCSSMVLVRNPRYWGPKPRLRELDLTFGAGYSEAVYYPDYRAGKYDLISAARSDDQAARADGGFHESPAPWLSYLQANLVMPPFDDLRVRQAFALALDKLAITELDRYQGAIQGTIPTNHVVPAGTPGYNTSLTGPRGITALTGAPDLARALWQSYVAEKCSGDATHCPKVVIHVDMGTGAVPSRLAQAMVAAWQAVLPGVRVEIDTWPGLLAIGYYPIDLIGRDHMVRNDWSGVYPDPQDWLAGILQLPAQSYPVQRASTRDPTAEGLLAQAEAATDPAARIALYQQLEQRMVDNVDVIPLYQGETAWVAKPYVVDYDPGSWYWVGPQQWAAIYIAKH